MFSPHNIVFPLVKLIAVCQYVVMVCIYCHGKTRVINSRPQQRANSTWRRRSCSQCGSVFTSIETVDLRGSIVLKRAGSVEPFSRDNLLLSVYDSLRHRKTALSDAEGLTNTILSRVYKQLTNATVERDYLVSVTQSVLNRFDKVAATYYLAFHPMISKKS